MIVCPLIRSVGLKAATASSRVAMLPMFVRAQLGGHLVAEVGHDRKMICVVTPSFKQGRLATSGRTARPGVAGLDGGWGGDTFTSPARPNYFDDDAVGAGEVANEEDPGVAERAPNGAECGPSTFRLRAGTPATGMRGQACGTMSHPPATRPLPHATSAQLEPGPAVRMRIGEQPRRPEQDVTAGSWILGRRRPRWPWPGAGATSASSSSVISWW